MKTIAVFHPSNELYGSDRILVHALAAFPEDAQKIVFLPKDGPLTNHILENVKNSSVEIVSEMPIIYRELFSPSGILKFGKNYRQFKKYIKAFHQEHAFNFAYVNTLACSFLLPLLRQLDIPSFVHVHEIIEKPRFIARFTAKLANRYSDDVICVSKAVENNLIRLVPEIELKTHCLHNGIPPIVVGEKETNGELTFYLFGRIMPKKGQWYLLDALEKLSVEHLSRCHFFIVGGVLPGHEYLKTELSDRIHALGLEEKVELVDFCPDITDKMKEADVCVVPSLMRDPFPTTVLEAMSAGKPVIATDHGGAAEVIRNGENGFLISPNRPDQFASVLKKIIDQRDQIRDLGNCAKQDYQTRFTLEIFKKNWNMFHATRWV